MEAIVAADSGLIGSAVYYLGFMPHASMQHNANRFLFNPLDLAAVPFLLLLSIGKLGRGGSRLLLLILFGTTVIAGAHAIYGHAMKQCIQDHYPVVVCALVGRAALLLCLCVSLLARQKGRSPTTLPAGR